MADELTNKFQDILEVKADPEAFRTSLKALTTEYETWVAGLKGKAENVLAGGLFGKITQVSQQMQAFTEMFVSASDQVAKRITNNIKQSAKATQEYSEAIQKATELQKKFGETTPKLVRNINTEQEGVVNDTTVSNAKQFAKLMAESAAQTERIRNGVSGFNEKLKSYQRSAWTISAEQEGVVADTAAQKIKEHNKQVAEAARKTKQWQDANQNMLDKFIGGMRGSFIHLVRFNFLQGIITNTVQGLAILIAAPFKAIADGMRYMRELETQVTDLQGVIASTSNFGGTYAENFKKAGQVAKDVIQEIQDRSLRLNITAEQLTNTFRELLEAGAGKGVKNMRQMVDLAQMFSSALKATSGGSLSDKWTISEITKLFNGEVGNDNKLLKTLNISNQEWKKLRAEGMKYGNMVELLTPKFKPFLDATAQAELNQSALIGKVELLGKRLEAIAASAAFEGLSRILQKIVTFVEEHSELVKEAARGVAAAVGNIFSVFINGVDSVLNNGESFILFITKLTARMYALVDSTRVYMNMARYLASAAEAAATGRNPYTVGQENWAAYKKAEDLMWEHQNDAIVAEKRMRDAAEKDRRASLSAYGRYLEDKQKLDAKSLGGSPEDLNTVIMRNRAKAGTLTNPLFDSKGNRISDEQRNKITKIIEEERARMLSASLANIGGGAKNSLDDKFTSKVPHVNLENGLGENRAQWDATVKLYDANVEQIKETYRDLTDAVHKQLSEQTISYKDAYEKISDYVQREKVALQSLADFMRADAEKQKQEIQSAPGQATQEQRNTQKAAVDSRLEGFINGLKKQINALDRTLTSAEEAAIKEETTLKKNHYNFLLKMQEQRAKEELSLLADTKQQGYLTEVEAFDKQVALEARLREIEKKTFAARLEDVKNYPIERQKVAHEAALAEDEYNDKVTANTERRKALVLAEEKALRDYASSMRDAAINAQELAISVQEVVNPLASMTKAYDDLYNSRRMALDLQERDLMLELQIAQARNASTDETRKLTTQIANLRNNRLSLYREQMSRSSSLAGTGLGTQTLAMRYTNDEAISTTSDRLQREIGEQRQHESKMLSQGFVTPGDIEIWATLQDNVKKTSEELEGLLNVGDELKSSWSNITEDFVGAFFGPEFSALWQKASDAGDSLGKVGLTAEGAAKGLQTVQGLVNAYQSGASQGGVLGGIGGVLNTGILGQVFKSTPIVGQIASVVGSAFSIVGGLFTRSAKKIAAEIKESFQDTVKAYQNGDATLIATLDSLKKQRDSAIRRLSGKKGGDKELESILEQFDDEIKDLEKEQKQILENFDSTLEGLQLHSEALDNVRKQWKEVTDQVKEYIGAGGDAAKAAELMSLTLRDMKETSLDSLNDGEQEAIQLATDLNDKLQERLTLTKEFKKSEFDLINADAVERRQAGSVTRGQQLKELREEYEKNLKNVNDEIALGEKKLDKYKEVYSLSTDIEDLHRRDEELTLLALDKEIQKLKDLKSIADSITLGTDGAWSSSSSLLQPASIAITVNVEGSGSAEETGQIIGDSIADELSRQYRMVPAV